MQVFVFTRQNQPGRHELERFYSHLARLRVPHEEIDGDSANGIAKAQLYDILSFPSLLVVRGDGSPIATWHGELPRPEDVSMAYRQ